MSDKYILSGHDLVPADLLTWARWFESSDEQRIVRQETLPNGRRVSTVFLGLDHQFGQGPPLLFETMVFPSADEPMDELDCERYATWDDAEAGHAAMVAKWQ